MENNDPFSSEVADPPAVNDPFAAPEPNEAPADTSDPFAKPQPESELAPATLDDPSSQSASEKVLAKWGGVPTASEPEPTVAVNALPPQSTLDQVLANFHGGDTPQPGTIQNNVPNYNDPMPNLNEPGVAHRQPLDPAVSTKPNPPLHQQPLQKYNTLDDVLDKWGFGSYEPLDDPIKPQPIKPETGGGGYKPPGGGGGYKPSGGDGRYKKKPDDIDFILDHFDYLGTDTEPGMPVAGGGKGGNTPDKNIKEDLKEILNNFDEGKKEPYAMEEGNHGPDTVKEDLKEILNNFDEGKKEPYGMEEGEHGPGTLKKDLKEILNSFGEGTREPYGGGHGPDHGPGDGKKDPLDGILDEYYNEKYEPMHHEPRHQDIIDHVLAKYYHKGEKVKKQPVYGEVPPDHPSIPKHPIEYPKPHGPVCIDRSLEAKRTGLKGRECIGRNQAICRNDFAFGIKSTKMGDAETYFVEAWHVSTPLMPLFQDFSMAKELCIGDSNRHDDTAYMTVRTEKEMYYLVCPGVGKARKNPKLKISENTSEAVVKFNRGSSDRDIMWKIKHDGTDPTNPHCTWEHVPLDKEGWDDKEGWNGKPEEVWGDTLPMPQLMPAQPVP